MRLFTIGAFTLLFSPWVASAFAQSDTLRLTPASLDSLLETRSLLVSASLEGVRSLRGNVDQSGRWSNPTLGVEQNIYNQYTRHWFDVGPDGNTDLSLSQPIALGGKRSAAVGAAESAAAAGQAGYEDLLRMLRHDLRTAMNDMYFTQRSLAFYDDNIQVIQHVVDVMQTSVERRTALLAELLRLKSLLFTLENERLGLRGTVRQIEAKIHTVLSDTTSVVFQPVVNGMALAAVRPDMFDRGLLIARALEHRPDIRRAREIVSGDEKNLQLQKALAVPDISVGAHWSRAGSYIPDYAALTLSVDLPLFNRNQGNIETAEFTLASDKALRDQAGLAVYHDVANALDRAIALDRLYRSATANFTGEYERLVGDMIGNYEKRNISVVEFADFIESYRASMLQSFQLENARADALEDLRASIGTSLPNE